MLRPRRALAVALAVGLSAVTLGALLFEGALWFNMPSRARYPIRGIDISHHQGAIDWARVDGEAWRFAWIKATEGGDWRDPRFAENWAGARRAGLFPGAYHFFTFCAPAAEQARNFLAVVPAEGDTLPPALDVELGGNCGARPTRDTLLADLDTFSDAVEAGLGQRPILYLTQELVDLYGLDVTGAWLRSIFTEPEPGWTVWQYGNRGRVAGIPGFVDVNAFAGDAAAFEGLLSGRPEPVLATFAGNWVAASGTRAPFVAAPWSVWIGQMIVVTFDLTLVNPEDTPRWIGISDADSRGQTVRADGLLRAGTGRVRVLESLDGAGRAVRVFERGDLRLYHLPAHARVRLGEYSVNLLDAKAPAVEIFVASTVKVDGATPLEQFFGVPGTSDDGADLSDADRGRVIYQERTPTARELRTWQAHTMSTLRVDVTERWLLRTAKGQVEALRCTSGTPGPCDDTPRPTAAPPVTLDERIRANPIDDAEANHWLRSTPDDALRAWLLRNAIPIGTDGTSEFWDLTPPGSSRGDGAYTLRLEPHARTVTRDLGLGVVPGGGDQERRTFGIYHAWSARWESRESGPLRRLDGDRGGYEVLDEARWRWVGWQPDSDWWDDDDAGWSPWFGTAAPDGPVEVTGALETELVDTLRARYRTDVEHCYQDARPRAPSVGGPVDVVVRIDAEGHVTDGTVEGPPTLARCVSEAARRWEFPSTLDGAPATLRLGYLTWPWYR